MKKNFLMVASLLIAAMLMVVSCTQEVAPKNEGLVLASINIADTRAISTTGEDLNDISYEYKLTKLFDTIATSSNVVGEMQEYAAIPINKQLGYVTQGLWKIDVQGKKDGKVVLSGSANHYFNNQDTIAKVFVEPSAGTGTLSITVSMQDLDDASDTKYEVKYALTSIDAIQETTPVALKRNKQSGNISSYTINENTVSVDTGYYRLTISVWGPSEESEEKVLLGGVTKSIRVLNGAAVVVTGSVEPMDFDRSEVNVVVIEPKGTIAKNVEDPKTGSPIEVTVTDDTDVDALKYAGYVKKDSGIIEEDDGNVYAVSYVWDVNGEKFAGTSNTNDLNFSVPGPKTVSCSIVYKVKSFGETYTYVSSDTDATNLTLNFIVNEASN